jgi:hypothetical protein
MDSLLTKNETVIFDTLIAPDYYQVNLIIAEYTVPSYTQQSGNIETVIKCDSILKTLKQELKMMGFDQELKLVKVTDKVNPGGVISYMGNTPSPSLKQESYLIKIKTAEDVVKIYKNISFMGMHGIKCKPYYSRTSIDKARKAMRENAISQAESNMNSFAIKYGYKINGIINYTEIPNRHFPTSNYNIYTTQMYQIDLEPISFNYQITITFELIRRYD